MDDGTEILTADPMIIIASEYAPQLAIGDLIHVDGVLYHVRTALRDGAAQTKCQLELPQWSEVERGADVFEIAFAGVEKGLADPAVAIAAGDVPLQPGDEIEGDHAWTVVSVGTWKTGLKWLVLAES